MRWFLVINFVIKPYYDFNIYSKMTRFYTIFMTKSLNLPLNILIYNCMSRHLTFRYSETCNFENFHVMQKGMRFEIWIVILLM